MRTRTVKINQKYPIKLLPHRANFYKSRLDWESERLDSMHKNIGKGDVVYYVGAEQGEMPALCQIWGAEVCLFEPNHTAWRTIKETWQANNLKRPLGLFAMFVGNETVLEPKNPDKDLYNGEGWKLGEDNYPLYANGDIKTESAFSELHNEPDGLPIVKIDDVASYTKGPTVISIDVEGAEFEVLKGAENTLLTYFPKIYLSLHPTFLKDYWNITENDVLKWLVDRGYDYELLADLHEKHYLMTPKK
jgi:FkbM family methyltransferase